ncbi:MAG TPA: Gfo/Idh/MocA family oxidoreductase [Candidatus Limnocylindrales bacterium]|nr:Gfo/Idh/MocA family oxidoreductase [Candidatus Limnocylindrales bacterium]
MSNDSSRTPKSCTNLDRRTFLQTTAAASGFLFLKPNLVFGTAANSDLRVGLLGCGGRGTVDATNLVDLGGARIVALADIFQDRLDAARDTFDKMQQPKGYPALDPKQLFLGPHAFQEIAHSKELDAIVIATPAYYHPQHFDAVVAAGKHVYLEKPIAVDVPGVKKVQAIAERADGKLSIDVGFQIRECPMFVELVRRIHAGALGKIVCGEAHYYAPFLELPQRPGVSDAERRLRTWHHDKLLSGDIILEQNIHTIDICNWTLQAHPLKAVGTGGGPTRDSDSTTYDHFNVVFTYPDGVAVDFSSVQFGKVNFDVNERFFGTRGNSQSPYAGPLGIWGEEPWQPAPPTSESKEFSGTGNFFGNLEQADPAKKKSFLDSITSGKFHNQVPDGAQSALACILGRTAAYTGREVTWDHILDSKEVLDPKIDLTKLR